MGILEAAWVQCFVDLDTSHPPACAFDEMHARYSEPHRAYHTLQHLEECMAWVGQVRNLLHEPGEVAFALFYHDVIYDTHASDNEARSADLALDVLGEYTGVDRNVQPASKR